MNGRSRIADDVLAAYSRDAALEVPGVEKLVAAPFGRSQGVRVVDGGADVTLEIRIQVAAGLDVSDVGVAVQERVADYVGQMAGLQGALRVDVTVAGVSPPPG